MQRYRCLDCDALFRSQKRDKIKLKTRIWLDFVFHKQTVRELAKTYQLDRRVIKRHLDEYQPREKIHQPRPVRLLVDAKYFGERTAETSWCIVVFRDCYRGENLWWTYADTETTSVYRQGRDYLESLGYTIRSVTGDGFGGIRTAFAGIPYQMCHVHIERLLRKGTTRNPKTEAGKVLRALTLSLFDTDSETFKRRYKTYLDKYLPFLNEKSINSDTGRSEWTHAKLRAASLNLFHHIPYLFTYEEDYKIPADTNGLEGHFRHVGDIVDIHCGLSRIQKKKFLDTVMLTSTIAPTEQQISKIFKI